MKLKSAILHNAIKAAYASLGLSATYTKTGIRFLSALQGNFLFLIDRFEVDSISSLDSTVFSFFKSLSDNPEAAEKATLSFYKSLAETGLTDDAKVLSFLKNLTDTVTVPEQVNKAFEKGLNDSVLVGDTLLNDISARDLVKALNENINVTDDIDGESSVLDDQEIQFFKVRANVANAADTLALSIGFNRNFTNTASSTDAGSLRNQGYADFTFFAEDYVGASRTFT